MPNIKYITPVTDEIKLKKISERCEGDKNTSFIIPIDMQDTFHVNVPQIRKQLGVDTGTKIIITDGMVEIPLDDWKECKQIGDVFNGH